MARLSTALYVFLVTQQLQLTASTGASLNTEFLGSKDEPGLPYSTDFLQIVADGPEIDAKTLLSAGDSDKPESAAAKKQKETIAQWFTWPFWRLIVMCSLTLLVFTDIVFPLGFHCVKPTLLFASILFLVEMLSFLIVGCIYADARAAGATHVLVLATIMCAIALLCFMGAVSLKTGKTTKSQQIVQDDLALVFRPISYVTLVFLIVHGLLSSTASDWGNLAVFASMAALGLAFAMSGVIKDMMSYVFIRGNEYFQEGDFIYHGGELVQVKHVYWCYTFAYRPKTRSDMFIPNSALTGGGLNNQSRDNARTFDHEVSLPNLSVDETTAFIKKAWSLLATLQENGFTGLNGEKYDCLVDVNKSSIYLSGPKKLHIKLFGKYYFSKPPQWKMNSPEPKPEARQMEWAATWNYQVEWFILEMKKIAAK